MPASSLGLGISISAGMVDINTPAVKVANPESDNLVTDIHFIAYFFAADLENSLKVWRVKASPRK